MNRLKNRFFRRSLKSRIMAPLFLKLGAFVLFVLIAGGLTSLRYSVLRNQVADASSINQSVAHIARLNGIARERLLEYRLTGEKALTGQMIAVAHEQAALITELKAVSRLEKNLDRTHYLRGFFEAFDRSVKRQGQVLQSIESGSESDIRRSFREWRALETLTSARLADLVSYMGKDLEATEARMNAFLISLVLCICGFLALAAGSLWIIARYYDRTVLHPLSVLSGSLNQVAKGNLDAFVSLPKVRDEIWRMSVDFNRMTETLRDSNADLRAFVSVAAHDIRSPLATIRGFADLAREDIASGDIGGLTDSIVRIEAIAGRSLEMVDQLLKLERAASAPIAPLSVDLRAVTTEVLDDLDSDLRLSGAIIEFGTLPWVEGDRAQLRTLFQNLISNALKYRREGVVPRVILGSNTTEDGFIEVTVADNGRGFDDSEAERLFEPFARLSSSAGTPGYGVGLSTCRKIVQRHGGSISAQGRPGQGATFIVRFPPPVRAAAADPRAIPPLPSESAHGLNLHGERPIKKAHPEGCAFS